MVVIGSYSQVVNPGIHFYEWEAITTSFSAAGSISGLENPSYLTLSKEKDRIYAITENKENSASWLHVFRLGEDNNSPVRVGSIPFHGAGSCHISTDSSNRNAFVSNYGEGTLTVLALNGEGVPGAVVQQVSFSGNGADPERQEHPHPHSAVLSPDEQHLFCADLGTDRLYKFSYQPDCDPPLVAADPSFIQLPPGSGPRQLTFTPDGHWLYVITELSGEILVFNSSAPHLGCLQRVPLTQEGYCGKIEGGDIQIDARGSFLYASNRGDANEIIVFAIDPVSGLLASHQRKGAAGLSPRSILISHQPDLLLVANEQSDNVSIFRLNADGKLEFTGNHLKVSAPTCLKGCF